MKSFPKITTKSIVNFAKTTIMVFGIGVFGPALDAQGNSIAGCKLLREISNELRLNLFYDPEWDKEQEEDQSEETVLKEMQAKSVM